MQICFCDLKSEVVNKICVSGENDCIQVDFGSDESAGEPLGPDCGQHDRQNSVCPRFIML